MAVANHFYRGLVPGEHSETIKLKLSGPVTFLPLNSMMTSPDLMPAFWAGRSGLHIVDQRAVLVGQTETLRQRGRKVSQKTPM